MYYYNKLHKAQKSMDMHKDNWYNILTNKKIARIFIPTGI